MAMNEITVTLHSSPELSAICERLNAGHEVHPDTVLCVTQGIGKPVKITLGDVINGSAVGTTSQKVEIGMSIGYESDPEAAYRATRRAIWSAIHGNE